MSREVTFYKAEAGNSPVGEFLDSLSAKQAQKVSWVLKLIEDLERIPTKYFKKLDSTDDIWEVRVGFGRDTFRLLGFIDGHRLVVLAHGFQKKTQKTPRQAIAIAEKRKKDYFRRKAK